MSVACDCREVQMVESSMPRSSASSCPPVLLPDQSRLFRNHVKSKYPKWLGQLSTSYNGHEAKGKLSTQIPEPLSLSRWPLISNIRRRRSPLPCLVPDSHIDSLRFCLDACELRRVLLNCPLNRSMTFEASFGLSTREGKIRRGQSD